MTFLRAFLLCLAVLPTQAFAVGPIAPKELPALIDTCFKSFSNPSGQPFKVDRARLARIGFVLKQDDAVKFEAFKPTMRIKVVGGTKDRGATFEIRRHKRKSDLLRHKACTISGDFITTATVTQARNMLVKQAARNGFRKMINARGNEIWVNGDVVVHLSVLYLLNGGKTPDTTVPRSIIVDGAHEKEWP